MRDAIRRAVQTVGGTVRVAEIKGQYSPAQWPEFDTTVLAMADAGEVIPCRDSDIDHWTAEEKAANTVSGRFVFLCRG